ncbi:RNA polymerase sigma factor [Polyangium sorediatum]|uniref:Sigma-70 family RNA polymerase sigma factor n=1 Tax=Polyangium sorediatum TaxID=889274 RepID=A0ABT6NWY4_9BACT|nr:sigma-70 family RNA polymerase sigma factor [Polyangium sorediatum]MDI1432823.1 sigma-70 family RNA polymerase sigma factor [Polyangium sorediatum]
MNTKVMAPVEKAPTEDLWTELAKLRPVVARFLESTCGKQAASTDAVDDETQDVMVEGYENLSAYRPESGTLVNWLLGIAANIRKRWRRACGMQEKRFAPTDDNDETPASQPSPERAAILAEACDRVGEALKTMPTEQRAVFSLVVFQGLSHAEVAKELGISEEASRMKFMRARAYIRERVDEVHGTALLILCGRDRRSRVRARWEWRLELSYRAGHAWSALMAAALLGSANAAAPRDVVASAHTAFTRQASMGRAAEPVAEPSEIGGEDPAALDTRASAAEPTQAAPTEQVHEHRAPSREALPKVEVHPSRLTLKWRKSR